ncbi:hypothetical protein ACHAXH_000316, partial [Discostella pseudostelligera]
MPTTENSSHGSVPSHICHRPPCIADSCIMTVLYLSPGHQRLGSCCVVCHCHYGDGEEEYSWERR